MTSKNILFRHEPSKYKAFRPSYPEKLFSFLETLTANKKVLECGAGSGQATTELARYFDKVIACDVSYGLLKEYKPTENVLRVYCQAEQLPLPTESIGLICVAQALHWFSLESFYAEAKRVLCPQGMIAVWCYNQANIDLNIDDIIRQEVYEKITQTMVPSQAAAYVHECYKTIPFPFEEQQAPDFEMKVEWDLNQLLGYISTWPSVLDFENKFQKNLVKNLAEKLQDVWGNPLSTKNIKWPIYLKVGKKV